MKQLLCSAAIAEAILEEMQRDETVFVIGQDIEHKGGSFATMKGLFDAFGEKRVKDTPISEIAMIGAAIGAAATGLRPIVEMNFMDFLAVCMDQVINQAAKLRYMSGGQLKLPLVVMGSCGGGYSAAAQHSQCLENQFIHVPGLKVVMPSKAHEFKGLLIASIRDDNPVLFMADKVLLNRERGPVPEDEYVIPLGVAEIKRAGDDVTLVAWGKMVNVALESARLLEEQEISVEVVDPRTLSPLDLDTILDSVAKTHRLVVLHEAVTVGGFGGEIAAAVTEQAFDYLDSPILRIGAPHAPAPFSPKLEQAYIPNERTVVQKILSLF